MNTPKATVLHGHCLEMLPSLADNSIDAIVTDPPYELTTGKNGTGGFMGAKWDATGIAFDVRVWQEALRVLRPGGHILVFGGTRTFHRVAVAIEDAGFEVRDSIAWIRANGLPKAPGQLKPGHEPIVVARKPFRGTLKANVATHGTGGLNIDACRLPATDSQLAEKFASVSTAGPRGNNVYGLELPARSEGRLEPHPDGRWPANVVLDELAAEELDALTGVTRSQSSYRGERTGDADGDAIYGGGSKFFYTARASVNERPSYINDSGEKVSHKTVKPLSLMRWLCRLITPPGGTILDLFAGSGTTGEAALLEGFSAILIEREADHLPLITIRLGRVS